MSGEFSRRDFIKAGGLTVLGLFLAGCGVTPEQATQIEEERKKYQPLNLTKSEDVTFAQEVENDQRIGAGRVKFTKEGGAMYFLNQAQEYQELGVFGSILPIGDPNTPESWRKLKELGLEATELFWLWQTPDGTIENQSQDTFQPAIDHIIAEDVQVMPMVNYSICDIIINSDGQKEYVFSKARLQKLMEKAGNNILGFQFDEPIDKRIVGGTEEAKFDYLKFIEEYSKECALPLRIINSGWTYLADDVPNNRSFHLAMLDTAVKNNIKIIAGSDFYPYLNEANEDKTNQQDLWALEYQTEKAGITSWLTLAAQSGWPGSDVDVFANMDRVGSELPFANELSGFAKLQLFQIISALAINPSYSRIDWWEWPAGALPDKLPFAKSQPGIIEAITKLQQAMVFMNGKVIDKGNSGGCDYSVKEVLASDGIKYDATFVHINQDDGFPNMILRPNTIYIDLISNMYYKTDSWFGQLKNPSNISMPKDCVMCLVPAIEV